jgi:hypothetical protein
MIASCSLSTTSHINIPAEARPIKRARRARLSVDRHGLKGSDEPLWPDSSLKPGQSTN